MIERLRPYYSSPLVRNSKKMFIPNKKGFPIYRAAGRLANPAFHRLKVNKLRVQPYKDKDLGLKIYQVCHDQVSFDNCIDNKFVTPLCLNPEVKSEGKTIEYVGKIKHTSNQVSESRAFLHYGMTKDDHEYIGFTSHRHDTKYVRFDYSCWLSNLNYGIVNKVFTGCRKVKLIGFRLHPPHDFIKITDIDGYKGASEFLYEFFKECYYFDEKSYLNLLDCMEGVIVPYCNCFIGRNKEMRDYVSFLSGFLDWADEKYGFDKMTLNVAKSKRGYCNDRGWGYICEQLIWYYLVLRYKKDFVMAFIDRDNKISYHNKLGYDIKGWKIPHLDKPVDLRRNRGKRIKTH